MDPHRHKGVPFHHSKEVPFERAKTTGRIALKSDGNPFFVFEILRGLREGQLLTQKPDGTWVTTQILKDIQVPSTIQDLVNARVADLAPEDRDLLDVAACCGFEFDPSLVGAACGGAAVPTLKRLAQIERKHRLVRSAGERFVFDHHQVQETLYAALPAPLAREYHAAVASALETSHGAASKAPETLDGGLCATVSEHLLKGAQGPRALRYLTPALRHMQENQLYDSAARLTDRALAVPGLVAGRTRCEILIGQAARLDHLGRCDAELSALTEAVALADGDGDRVLRARARVMFGWHLGRVSRADEAIDSLTLARNLAAEAKDHATEAAANGELGGVYFSLGDFATARTLQQRRLEIERACVNRGGEAIAAGNLGNACFVIGRFTDARRHLERQLEIAREDGLRRIEALATGNLGALSWSDGHSAHARELFQHALALSRAIGHRLTEATANGNLGALHIALGRRPESREHLSRYISLSREIGYRRGEAFALHFLADLAAEQDDFVGAESRLAESLDLRRAIGHRDGVADALRAQGALFSRLERESEARAALHESLALARELTLFDLELLARAGLAALPGGDIDAAVAAFVACEARVGVREAMEARHLLWQATHDLAHLGEAKRLLDHLVAHAPLECRDSMLANVRLHREIAAAAKEHLGG